jgi:DNA-binding PadR family transcriptional regulator
MTDTDHRRLALLGLLHHTGANGYQLHAHASGMGIIGLKRPAAYNLLDTMVRKGWLEALPPEDDGRTLRRYELTERGRAATRELMRAQLPRVEAPDLPSLVSLVWLDLLPRDEARVLLEQRAEALENELTTSATGDDGAHGGVIGRVLDHVRRVRTMELDLVNAVLRDLGHGGAL